MADSALAFMIEQLTLARLEERPAQRVTLEFDAQEVAQLERMIAAKRRNVTAVGRLARSGWLIQLAGTDSLASKAPSFGENFLTVQQRLAPLRKQPC